MNQFKDQIERIMTGKTCIPAVIVPLITALIFGYIFSNNQILESSVAVLDLDNSNYSRQLIGKLDASPYIEVNRVLNVPLEPEQLLINEQYLAVITLPQNLEANMYSGKQSNIGFILDYTVFAGSANLKQAIAEIFASENITISISKLKNMGYSGEQALGLLNALSLQQRSLFNPTMDYVSSNVFGFVNLYEIIILYNSFFPCS
jgi:ABC-2 type transport system permease protein